MYIVKLKNGTEETTIHGLKEKVKSGNVVKGINTIDSFSFSLLPSNAGFDKIHDLQTLISVFNTNKNRFEFQGRVLYSVGAMDEQGFLTKEVVCENYLGFLCDSQQKYVAERNWTVKGLFSHIVNRHNSQVEEYKRFEIGVVDVTDPNDNLYVGIQRENSWETIKKKLIDKLGGEIAVRVVDGVNYLDYLKKRGTTRSTEIALSLNMKAITKEDNPLEYISRLIPLGAKIKDADGNETEERIDITSVNNGLDYIESEEAVKTFGIRYGTVNFDDVHAPNILLTKGRNYLAENNRVQRKYTVSALDLSLLGLVIDDFDVCNYHPIKNPLLGIDDTARIIKKTINVVDEIKSSFEIGDNFKTLSDLQIEQYEQVKQAQKELEITKTEIKNSTGSTQKLESTVQDYKETNESQLRMLEDEIALKFIKTIEEINNVNGDLQSKFTELYKYFKFTVDGLVIGSKDNEMTLTLDNDMIVFKKNGVEFGWWDGNEFHTGNIVVEVNERAQFGNFAFVPRSDGSLSFLKVQ